MKSSRSLKHTSLIILTALQTPVKSVFVYQGNSGQKHQQLAKQKSTTKYIQTEGGVPHKCTITGSVTDFVF